MKAEIGVRARLFFAVVTSLLLHGCATAPTVACTMEAKQCPDGSYVGRDPAMNCQFRPCAR